MSRHIVIMAMDACQLDDKWCLAAFELVTVVVVGHHSWCELPNIVAWVVIKLPDRLYWTMPVK